MTDLGRILQVDFVLHDICPHRRTSVGIIVTELMDDGIEASRGFKVLTIPAHTGSGCRDVHVMCVPFVLPETRAHAAATTACAQGAPSVCVSSPTPWTTPGTAAAPSP